MSKERILVLINNVSSVQRLVDTARLVYGLGYSTLIATRIYGAAAQSGIPEVMKIAYKQGKNFLVLASLSEVPEIFPEHTLYAVSPRASLTLDELARRIQEQEKERIIIAVNGIEQDFTAEELRNAKTVWIKELDQRIGPIPELAIILYKLRTLASNEKNK